MTLHPRWRRTGIAALLVCTLAVALPSVPSGADGHPYLVQYDIATAAALSAVNPANPPPGVDVPCQVSSEHPDPVILIDGTHANMELNWGGSGPTLANAGYCVYSAPIGGDPHEVIQTCGPVLGSVAEIASLVAAVRRITGAAKVDLVGHSQGGLIAEYYAKFVEPGWVANLALLAPTTHGATVSGLITLPPPFGGLATKAVATDCPAVYDQTPTAPLVERLNSGPVAIPGARYTVIETRFEEVVTPAPSSAFIDEPGVRNEVVQDYCPLDTSEHVNLAYSTTAWQLVMTALDPSHPRHVGCAYRPPG